VRAFYFVQKKNGAHPALPAEGLHAHGQNDTYLTLVKLNLFYTQLTKTKISTPSDCSAV
jgi:hypothetical protein